MTNRWFCSPRRAAFAGAVAALLFSASCCLHAERLSQAVIPTHYDLKLSPDIKAATFSGVEKIDVDVKDATKSITLNSLEIEYQAVTITADGKEQKAEVSLDKEKEEATFTVPDEIAAGKATIAIHYTGILNNELRGFYLSKTARRNYAVTQFESTDARRAFPSFDEPAFKATFTLTMVVDKDDTVISNTSIVAETPGPGPDKHTLRFDETPKMSTYLLAFLVGDFKCTNGMEDGVKIGVCSTPDKLELTHYGLDVAKYVLHYYDTYFGIHFPLKKLDLIGIPDFEAGAMENFGAITYRETDLLIDPKTATIGAKKNVAEVIAHEMAHQWFGDLVTMEWWNNVWLNEGFATWMENKPVAAMHPDWDIDQDVIASKNSTLNLDAQPTTRAIRAKADTREEIEQMFDGISYGKGSDVLLTVENYVGPEVFRKGVQAYLKAHEYGNATAEDFWNAQTQTSGKPVNKIMDSLITQEGEPILTFGKPKKPHSIAIRCGEDSMVDCTSKTGATVTVSQKRFYLDPSTQGDTDQKWTVPVCFKTAAGQQCDVLTPEKTSLKVPAGSLFFADAGGKGYYRTAYPASVYHDLVEHVESGLKATERISLIGDEWAQVRSNKATVGDYLNLVGAVKDDKNAPVLGAALGGVDTVYSRVASTTEERDAVAKWLRDTFSPVYEKMGAASPSDSPNTREMRAQLFGVLGYYGKDPAVLKQAREIADKYLDNPASVEPSMGQTALAIAARNGDAELFEKLQNVYETSKDPQASERALRLMAEFENPQLNERALNYALTDKVRSQDAAIQFAVAMQLPATREHAWQFVQDHWDAIHKLLTPELGNILVGSTGAFCSADARDQVQQFFATHKVASAERGEKHAVEAINGCIELRKDQGPNLKQWISQNGGE